MRTRRTAAPSAQFVGGHIGGRTQDGKSRRLVNHVDDTLGDDGSEDELFPDSDDEDVIVVAPARVDLGRMSLDSQSDSEDDDIVVPQTLPRRRGNEILPIQRACSLLQSDDELAIQLEHGTTIASKTLVASSRKLSTSPPSPRPYTYDAVLNQDTARSTRSSTRNQQLRTPETDAEDDAMEESRIDGDAKGAPERKELQTLYIRSTPMAKQSTIAHGKRPASPSPFINRHSDRSDRSQPRVKILQQLYTPQHSNNATPVASGSGIPPIPSTSKESPSSVQRSSGFLPTVVKTINLKGTQRERIQLAKRTFEAVYHLLDKSARDLLDAPSGFNMSRMAKRHLNEVRRVEEIEKRKAHWIKNRKLSPEAEAVAGPVEKHLDGLDYHDTFTLNDEVYCIGDCVEMMTTKRKGGNSLVVCYGRITRIHSKRSFERTRPIRGTKTQVRITPPVLFDVDWFWHSSETTIRSIAGRCSRDLKLSHDCDHGLDASAVLCKVDVKRRRKGAPPPRKGYYYSTIYDEEDNSYATSPVEASPIPPSNALFTSDCARCHKLAQSHDAKRPQIILDDEENHMGKRVGFRLDGKEYHRKDLLYIAIPGETIFLLASLVGYACDPEDPYVSVEWFVRLNDLITNSSSPPPRPSFFTEPNYFERELVSTGRYSQLPMDMIAGRGFLTSPIDGIADDVLSILDDPDSFICRARLTKAAEGWIGSDGSVSKNLMFDASLISPLIDELVPKACHICDHRRETYHKRELKLREDPLKCIELYAGVGRLPAGIVLETGMEIDTAIELNEYAAAALRIHSPSTSVICDTVNNAIAEESIHQKQFDVLCGGFPLFLNAIAELRPSIVIGENVSPFTRAAFDAEENDKEIGSVLGFCIQFLLDLGYQVRVGILNAASFGASQNRNRVFIMASLDGVPLPAMPEPTHSGSTRNTTMQQPAWCGGSGLRTSRRRDDGAPHKVISFTEGTSDLPPFEHINPLETNAASQDRVVYNPQEPVRLHDGRFIGFRNSPAYYLSAPATSLQYQARSSIPASAACSLSATTEDPRPSTSHHYSRSSPLDVNIALLCEIGIRGLNGAYGDARDGFKSRNARVRARARRAVKPLPGELGYIDQLDAMEEEDGDNEDNHSNSEDDGGGDEGVEKDEDISLPGDTLTAEERKMPFRRMGVNEVAHTTLTRQHEFGGGNQSGRVHPIQHRMNSLAEIMRGQGFSDDTDFGPAPYSQKMKMIGNAVHLAVSRAIGREIRLAIGSLDLDVNDLRAIQLNVRQGDKLGKQDDTHSFLAPAPVLRNGKRKRD